MVWRPFYFARLVVDPDEPRPGVQAGRHARRQRRRRQELHDAGGGAHGDWHDVWIDPANPKQIFGGDDGGLWISYDGGNRWWKADNLPISQFYHVSVDNAGTRTRCTAGLQDNSSWVGDSSYPGGITNARWENLYGGDGFWTFADPADPNYRLRGSRRAATSAASIGTRMRARDIQP